MKVRLFRGYVQAIGCGLVVLVAAVIIALQWANKTVFSLFGKNYGSNVNAEGGLNTALVIVFSAAAGILLWHVIKFFVGGMMIVLRERPPRPPRAVQPSAGQAPTV